ncbi:hypothetical protein PR202_ga30366 [Eleusine coracana subsp. coracana]|uniref:non-specific serine/threonine protein kinase n=1 Tax=Eleusine coracana subsp. coracana TaxID=191504 RepID=A0AAV5DN78_ELECO|nr:hypothetical protein PR202_ga30366 [Eleusine coracana subsp. coracana]
MAPLFLLPFLLLQISPYVQAQTNISLGSSLTPQGPNSSWLSPSGEFAFGFLPMEGNSSAYLLAVWFHKISNQTVAWYAKTTGDGPAEPVQVSSGSRLQLTSSGVLMLLDPTGTQVWNPKVIGAAYANMLDTGNFVLDAADGSTKWGTFNNPADTILPTQILTPGMTLRSRIIATDYSDGRFLLNMRNNLVALYPIAVPSGYGYNTYWSKEGSIKNLVFDATGRIYVAMNSTQINMTSVVTSSMADYYHRATLDPDGAFRQYVYPKKASKQSSQAWSVVGMVPDNICQATTTIGSGTCGFNSYCMLDDTNNQTTCMCPAQYSFIDEDRKYKGCKPDFLPQSCDLDEGAAVLKFQLTSMDNVDWPFADYEQQTPVTKNDCQNLCLTDCFCSVAVFHDSDKTCWKKKMPLSNGMMGDFVQRTVFIKVPKDNSSHSELPDSSKWKKDKKCGRVDFLVEGDDEAILNLKNVERFVEVALWCLQEDPTIRPTMLKVTQMLDGAAPIPTPPDPASFVSTH